MKKLAFALSLLSLTCFAEETPPEAQYTVGLGMGSLYSGIGANFGFISKIDMKYISAGCTEYSSRNGSSCGFGLGWITTDLFNADSNKHGFGIYASLVGEENYATLKNGKYDFHSNSIYGVGASYTFFMNGIDRSGMTLGASIHVTNADYEDNFGGFLTVGYQF